MAHEVADRIYRLGAALVNWYLIEDGGRLTVVDAGNPNQYGQLPDALAQLGRTIGDVDAVVLTHATGIIWVRQHGSRTPAAPRSMSTPTMSDWPAARPAASTSVTTSATSATAKPGDLCSSSYAAGPPRRPLSMS